MNHAEFQERYEREGDAEYQRYLAMPPEALVDAVRAGEYGAQYQLWPAIAAKVPLDLAGWPLFRVVASDAPYLVRYHAAGALLSLLQSSRFVAADLAVASPQRQNWIAAVEAELEGRVGRL